MNKKFEVDILSASNFTSFGFCMSSRKFSTPCYRYGFNGKEKDDEINSEGNSYDYGFRIYNPALGRFLSVDPLFRTFAMLTPYQYASNSPIQFIDLDGLEGTRPVVASQRTYINLIGIEVYEMAKARGYSAFGAAMMLTISANEVGYGRQAAVDKALKYNNFFGIGGVANFEKYAQPTVEAGITYGLDKLFELNYKTFVDLAKKEGEVTYAEMDKALNNGRLGVYNTNPEGAAYATWLANNIRSGVLDRTLTVLKENINQADIQLKSAILNLESVNALGPQDFDYDVTAFNKVVKELNDKITTLDKEKRSLQSMYNEIDSVLHPPAEETTTQK